LLFKAIKFVGCFILIGCLSGCGFHSLYAKSHNTAEVSDELQKVRIESIPDRNGQILRNYMIDALGYKSAAQSKKYSLKTSLTQKRTQLGTKADRTATREKVDYTANYNLYDLATGKQIIALTSRASLNYNLISEQFSIITARESSERKALKTLSESMLHRLSLYFKSHQNENLAETNS
jgi:LPS-assembly lipoprotein